MKWFTNRQAVTHPSSNHLIETQPLVGRTVDRESNALNVTPPKAASFIFWRW